MTTKLLDHVRSVRDKAKGLRERKQFDSAIAQLEEVIDDLEEMLGTVRQTQDWEQISPILEVLSQTYGQLGGTWRDAKDFKKAEEYYDKGNEYEEERRRDGGAMDSYNLLQRLVVRLLGNPALINHAEFVAKLKEVKNTIQEQFGYGRNDSWGLADLALVQILCSPDADFVIADLEQRQRELQKGQADKSFYKSTYDVVVALIEEGLGKGELGARLEEFKRLLQRKGGVKLER
jgi:tetratricopeptide (TPR) repeat protein